MNSGCEASGCRDKRGEHISTLAEEFDLFREWAACFHVILKAEHLRLFRIYMDELWAWNQHINITGAATRLEVLVNLFLDSLIPGPYLPETGNLLDVGSGGGFPGIPLKIYKPDLTVDLLEAKSKRVSFLKHVIRLLRLEEIRVVRGRIGTKEVPTGRDWYDVVTARALASAHQTVLWCAPFLRQGGMLVLFLGSEADKALTSCEGVLNEHSMVVGKRIPYLLPSQKARRNAVIIKKLTAGSQ